MQSTFGLLLLAVSLFFNLLNALPLVNQHHHRRPYVHRRPYTKGLADMDPDDTYFALSNGKDTNDELNMIAQVRQLFLDRINEEDRKNSKIDLTLCHFKICNMGRKRTRYIHVTKTLDNDS